MMSLSDFNTGIEERKDQFSCIEKNVFQFVKSNKLRTKNRNVTNFK